MKLFNRYPHFNFELKDWFTRIQSAHPEAHISCAGRGRIDQEALYARKATKAHWGQSAHNYGIAIDVWELRDGLYTLDPKWFHSVMAPKLLKDIVWFGREGAPYYELPHFENSDWYPMVKNGTIQLVE